MTDACAIIAGAGSFPLHVAQEARRQGRRVIALGLQGWVNPELARHVDEYEEVAVGQLGRLIDRLKTHQTRQAVMAGKVTKGVLFDSRVQFDPESLLILGQAKGFSVNQLLGAIGARLAKDGIELLDSSTFLQDSLCPAGVLTRRRPTPEEDRDMRAGAEAARQLAGLDIGQTVVVKHRVIVAVEALEGTDAAIRRAGQLAGDGLVVVKMASPAQDRRFDLPVLGPQTVAVAISSGVRCVAVAAQQTVLLDKPALIARADEADLSLVGIDLPAA